MENAEDLLRFWFGDDLEDEHAVAACCRTWFAGDGDFDAQIRARFANLPARVASGDLHAWGDEPRGALALVIALDQLPRNLDRGRAGAFAHDAQARQLAEQALSRGDDRRVHPLEALFFYLPLEHAEDRAAQQRCVELCESLLSRAPDSTRTHYEGFLDYANRHRAVIERFGRFPHRNQALDRVSTDAEREYLLKGGDRF